MLIYELFETLSREFEITDLGKMNQCLGCNIFYNDSNGDITICNESYIDDLLQAHDLTNCNIVSTPLPDGLMLSPHDCPPINEVDRELQSKYRSIVGSLMFAALYWRPDICFSVGHLSRFLHVPGIKHL
mmetsp:Transcript_14819/g.13404  ORF Transcript_14819/g.13404 Transcript_14819/m.13404 type:complete len:129 (+) Transcript_14819:1477-1863(+)